MTHPIIEDLNRRYTTKRYDAAQKISADDMAVIREALRLSPSSINAQPWKFIIIESDAAKKRFHDTFSKTFEFNQKHATEASHTILFAYNPRFTKEDYVRVIDNEIKAGRLTEKTAEERMAIGMFFAGLNTDENGCNGVWTRSQIYLALGNIMHTAARLKIDSTPMEGIDSKRIAEIFKEELDGYVCEVALALGYHKDGDDYNHDAPKSRLPQEDVVMVL
ncbi:MAG: NAD(P)H-dependent oxidoreductase [Proteobacteria bacterium]|nr:MAG: NAD(P)H-dependent oxidoreductase [Pseudomonadota bacterium]PIE65443.1 MAG: NAD(P)H-dependent oxidoreductase [Desulfobacterales bacterium]